MNNRINCKWLLRLEIKPSLSQSESINDYHFEVKDNRTFTEIRYETNSFDEILPEAKSSYEYAEKTLVDKFILEIHDLLLIRMIYLEVSEHIDIKVLEGPKLLNADELRSSGERIGRHGQSLAGLEIIVVMKEDTLSYSQTLSSSQTFWGNGFSDKSSGREEDVLRIADWFQRAEGETDHIKKLVLYWIGFNGLYGLLSLIDNKINDNNAKKIDSFIETLLSTKAGTIVRNNSGSLNALESYDIMSESGNTNWSNALKNERNKPNPDLVVVLKYAMKCIYGIRN